MSALNPDKLHVTFQAGTSAVGLKFPRRYTLTHSDMTGDLFLTVGAEYDRKQTGGLYTRLMRDEALAELVEGAGGPELHVHVHVSGGLVFGTAAFRNAILHQHLPLVLQAVRHGDRALFETHPELDAAGVQVHFAARQRRFNIVEGWGLIGEYRPGRGRQSG
jgi:hypothetical protein